MFLKCSCFEFIACILNVGRSIRALYENGWHVGKIAYFNKSLKEYKIDYADQTIDYISPHEIGGHDVCFVDVN